MDYDVVIVGGGLAGLAAGAYLSLQGKRVILIEQHNIVGGSATHFTRQRKMKFEVGLHEMDSVGSDRGKHILQSLGVWDRLEFVRVPEFYRLIHAETDVIVPDNIEQARHTLVEAFPSERHAIHRYFDDLVDVRQATELLNTMSLKQIFLLIRNISKLWKLKRYKNMTVAEYLAGLTDDFELKLAITANMGYFHDDASELSMLLFAAGQSSYMTNGGWFIKGGSQRLSDELAAVINENGGTIILKHKVEEIVVRDGIATGVRYRRQRRPYAELKEVTSDYVIFNGGIPTITSLIPSLAGKRLKYMDFQHGVSLMTIYLSFSKPIADLTDNIYSTFVVHDDIDSFEKMTKIERSDDFDRRGFVFVDYGAIDSGLGNDSNHTAVICGFDYLRHWEGLKKPVYKEKKQKIMKIFLDKLEDVFPGIKERISYAEMATAKTIKRYTLNPSGTVYGFAPTPEQFLQDRTKDIKNHVKNLEFTSAWAHMGGFSPAITGGRRVGKKVLKLLNYQNYRKSWRLEAL